MADVTVRQLAEVVGAPVERLLKQMQEAGLPQTAAAETVSDQEKQVLLTYLKRSHGKSDTEEPKKITLKRKVTSKLKAPAGRGKSVNIEVRKKRTYVKRALVEDIPNPEEIGPQSTPEPVEEAPAAEVVVGAAVVEAVAESAVEEQAPQTKAKAKEGPAGKPPGQAPAKDNKGGQPAKAKKKGKPATAGREDDSAARRGEKKKDGRKKTAIFLNEEEAEEEEFRRNRRKAKAKEKTKKNDHAFAIPTGPIVHEVPIPEVITVSELSQKMAVKTNEVIKTMFKMGVVATSAQSIDQETAAIVVEELGHKPKLLQENAVEMDVLDNINYEGEIAARPPVVTVMGHVDHGKTSLLDYIRKAKVTASESGGITQHIGAYHVDTGHGVITFLDTPGHAAFTAMRARGASATDVVILVVAADDGVMPQTEEAIQHSRAAGVPIVVAVNKMDKEAADPERVKTELSQREVIPEDWGGDVQFVPVSAHSGQGIDELLEAILLQAEVLELNAVPDAPAKGLVVESRLDKGRGPVATLLVQNGTLKQGDIVLVGGFYGRARAVMDENGQPIKSAGPSIPVEVLGLNGTPDAGDEFTVVESEKKAREVAEFRQHKQKEKQLQKQQAAKLDSLFAGMGENELKTLNVVLKTDVRGSLEAITASLQKLGNEEARVNIVSGGVGGISETDANLALASSAVIFGFNVRADGTAKTIVEKNELDMRYYSVIYDMVDDVNHALSGLLAPELREEIVGIAEVRDIFNSPKFGLVAGCMVVEGTVFRNKKIRVLRDNIVIYEGELESLRRFKDDVNEVRSGFECGIAVKSYNDVKVGDKIEVFDVKEVARTLS